MRPTPDRKEAVRASRRDERRLRRSFSRRRLPPLRPPARGVAHDVPRVARHDPRAARPQWSGEVHAPRDARHAAASVFRQHSLRNARHVRRTGVARAHRRAGTRSLPVSGADCAREPCVLRGPLRDRRHQCAALVRRSKGLASTRAAKIRSRVSLAGCGSAWHWSAR